ncbi:MAG: SagB/ThcOx family dehydrogenase [Candidatus Acidiferrales bacterium]
MSNRQIKAAWEYHNATKHSWESVRRGGHRLDFDNYPLPFKVYPQLGPIPLPREGRQSGIAALSAIAESGAAQQCEAVPDLATLAQILFFCAGITKTRKFPGGEIFFRAAACTGALYEIELYLVCGELLGLAAGVYHFNPADFALRRLREGDYRGALAGGTAGADAVRHAPAILISTGTYWRNAWKYQARTYRHFGWDNGTLHANLLAMCAAWRLPTCVVCGFADDDVNHLLGLDTQREVALTLVPVGRTNAAPPVPPEIASLGLQVIPPSKREVDYPAMRAMHAASSLAREEVAVWRGAAPSEGNISREQSSAGLKAGATSGERIALEPLDDDAIPRDTIEQVILRRGSSRRFTREPITFAQLSTLLDRATRGIPADFLVESGAHLNELYIVANAVEGLPAGAYYFHRASSTLECVKQGNFRERASYLGLDQELPGDAAACIFFLADLRAILERFGNRGYRAVQLEAGILGGKLYLAAYAQNLGATGLTFYDDDVAGFFSPHAQRKSPIFLVALGHPARRPLVNLPA